MAKSVGGFRFPPSPFETTSQGRFQFRACKINNNWSLFINLLFFLTPSALKNSFSRWTKNCPSAAEIDTGNFYPRKQSKFTNSKIVVVRQFCNKLTVAIKLRFSVFFVDYREIASIIFLCWLAISAVRGKWVFPSCRRRFKGGKYGKTKPTL